MIAILTSGIALGVHVPGLLLARRLTESGVDVRVDVLERYFDAEKRTRIPDNKRAFHRNFRVALAGQGLARDVTPTLDEPAVAVLLSDWAAAGVERLVVFSGFWTPVVDRYAEAHPNARVDLCHVDSVRSPSFRPFPKADGHRDVWLLNADSGAIPQTIPVSRAAPVPWGDRDDRCLAHGGGWGMGTYAERAAELAGRGVAMDVIAYEPDDVTDPRCRYFMIDPDWQPWQDDGFPPFGELGADGSVSFRRSAEHHDSFHLMRRAKVTISKPGGGTLLDSLSSATPVVLLEPFGDHEARNAELWCRLGFGLSYADWLETGCSFAVLEELHHNLRAARARVPSYPDALVEESLR
jgi:hypothetical protein